MTEITLLPTLLEEENSIGVPDTEITTCTAIGQTARAERLRLLAYAKFCGSSGLQFIGRYKRDSAYSYPIDSPDIDLDGKARRRTDLCALSAWCNALPTELVDHIVTIKDKIDLDKLYIEYKGDDPALLYYLGQLRGKRYYVKLAQWE